MPDRGRRAARGRGRRAGWLAVALLLAQGAARIGPAGAQSLAGDPTERDRWLFNLLPRVSDDPDLLSAREALMRQKLLDLGVDPRGEPQRPTLETILRRRMADAANAPLFEPPRVVEILEVDARRGLVSVYRFPETYPFFTSPDTNVVGVAFEPQRALADSSVQLAMHGRDGWLRTWRTIGFYDKWGSFFRQRKAATEKEGGLLNFTVPIRLPRTIERLIGRGDATNIRISGSETISIAGESTVRSNFLGSEVRQNQSLFPTLEMEQQLRVQLEGTVGEKIKVRVSHDSEAIGTAATEVKLAFEGDEDDIIQTIRAGNIDVTLPGSALLGVSASRGGLFGIKVEGALGGLKFVALTSKEQSQQSKSTFNQSGGTEEEVVIHNTDYIKNRYFRLSTLQFGPLFFPATDTTAALQEVPPVDVSNLEIDPNSIELFVSTTLSSGADILDLHPGIAFLDTSGVGFEASGTPFPQALAGLGNRGVRSAKWKRLSADDWGLLLDNARNTIGVVLTRSLNTTEALGAVYNLVDKTSQAVVYRVGRSPDAGQPTVPYIDPQTSVQEDIYLFKLIKPDVETQPEFANGAWGPKDLTWEYMFRNWYDLRGVDIDARTFEVKVQRRDIVTNADLDANGIPWLRVFGLDRQNEQGGSGRHDDRIDTQTGLVDFEAGTLQFPDFTPFDLPNSVLANRDHADTTGYTLPDQLRTPNLYRSKYANSNPIENDQVFDLVVKLSSTSSRFRLNAINIKEGSEQVTVDGAVLARGTDYEIDYFTGEVTLKDNSRLNAQSNVQITYEVDPLFGGGRTSLHGFNLQYELGQNKSLSTTWLLQSQPSPNRKPRLGEEPSRTWVGNVAAKMRFAPGVLTWLANLLPLVETDDASTVTLDSEVAVSVPNPNTQGNAYLEDFESVDDSEDINLSREGWYWPSLPAEYDTLDINRRRMGPADRAFSRWYRPVPAVKRDYLNPTLSETEKNDVVTALQLHLISGSGAWQTNEFGGIMRGFAGPVDLTQSQFLEFWVNDKRGAPVGYPAGSGQPREGRLHFDFGTINEDFYWPPGSDGNPVQYTYQNEDQDLNGTASFDEDVGLDGLADGAEGVPYFPQQPPGPGSDTAGDNYRADESLAGQAFPFINGTENNQRLDSEDLNRNTRLDLLDGYFTVEVDLADTSEVIADVYRDYADVPGFIQDSMARGDSWRKFRVDLRRMMERRSRPSDNYQPDTPDLANVRYLRIWYDNPGGTLKEPERDIVFAEMRFLGNRWRTDGLRNLANRRLDASALCPDPAEPGAREDFRLGVVNNKENPDYIPPVFPDTRNNIAEKEQSLLFSYSALAPGHQGRARKDIPAPQGQDFSVYGELNFFWRAPLGVNHLLDRQQLALQPYFWVGTDSTNYYEVSFSFAEADQQAPIAADGWVQVRVDLASLTNVKLPEPSEAGRDGRVVVGADTLRFREGEVPDIESPRTYHVRAVGHPDLRRVRRYYAGVRYPDVGGESGCGAGPLLSGEVLFNEIRLRDVDRRSGFAKRVAVNTTLAGVGDVGVTWSETDPEFRGLNAKTGTNVLKRDWEVRGSSRLDRFIPTLGQEVQFQLSKRGSLQLPRFRTNTDIELIDEASKEAEKTTTSSSSYNFQIRRTKASRNKILAYTWDRLGYSRSGSSSRETAPTAVSRRQSTEDRYSYDLNLTSGFDVKLPLLGTAVRYLPNQLSLSSNWRLDDARRTPFLENEAGERRPGSEQVNLTKAATHTATLNYSPLRSLRGTLTVTSTRDRVRPERAWGINWGAEDNYSQRLTLSATPQLPWVRALQPDLSYTGNYAENRRIVPRPADLPFSSHARHINNDRDITARWQMDLGGLIRKRFGGAPAGTAPPRRPAEEQRRDQRRLETRGRRTEEQPPEPAPGVPQPGAQPDSTAAGRRGTGRTSGKGTGQPPPGEQFPPLPVGSPQQPPPDQPRPGQLPPPIGEQPPPEGEEQGQIPPGEEQAQPPPVETPVPEPPPTGSPTQPPAGTGEGPAEAAEAAPRKLDPLAPLKGITRPFVTFAKEMQPIRASWSLRNTSSFQFVRDRAASAYRFGFSDDPHLPAETRVDSLGAILTEPDHAEAFGQTSQLQLSTQSKLSPNITLDLSYQEQNTERSGSGRTTRDVSVQWPTATVKLQGAEKWRIFGDAFASSSFDISLRRTKDVRGITATSYQPRHSTTLTPRWNFRFKSDVSGNLGLTLSNDVARTNDKDTVARRIGGNLKLQKSFDAEGALGFLRFGHKGLGTKIDSTLDVTYDKVRNFRRYEDANGQSVEDQPTGNSRLSVAPNFSYQFSRAVRAGLRLSYSRTKDESSKINTQSFGLGLNATLTF